MSAPPRTHPGLIRRVLDDAEATNCHAAAIRAGVDYRTAWRWVQRRKANPGWPTDHDIADWETKALEKGAERTRKAAARRDYTKRRYIARGPMLIDSTGTVRRLRALYAIGWTSSDIAPMLGCTPARVGHLISGKRVTVHRHTASRVDSVYRQLCMTVPQDPDVLAPRMTRTRARQRRQSAAKGWVPPLAWDDIDDPDETPALGDIDTDLDHAVVFRVLSGDWHLTANLPERIAVLSKWQAAGRTDNDLERLTGWKICRDVRPHLPREEHAA